ncbi:unnamed protein product, partial [Linum tenue]
FSLASPAVEIYHLSSPRRHHLFFIAHLSPPASDPVQVEAGKQHRRIFPILDSSSNREAPAAHLPPAIDPAGASIRSE